MTRYRERLVVPAAWWLIPVAATGSVWLAVQHVYGPRVSVPVAAAVLLLAGAGLIRYGRVLVAVEPDGFTAGRASLPLWAVGEIVALDAVRARAARGPEADPQAYLLVRGYVGPMIQVTVDDPADPVPYWLVSTRHPEKLAAALSAARDGVR
ncbi:MAG TPA: DUF3093 domain-containing protein [Jiangellaceae bacterium]|jgi:Protein of unknown function (DUF3093)|nr:DUF3093 domain-containing protein [Jiangellaceae bacterium]